MADRIAFAAIAWIAQRPNARMTSLECLRDIRRSIRRSVVNDDHLRIVAIGGLNPFRNFCQRPWQALRLVISRNNDGER